MNMTKKVLDRLISLQNLVSIVLMSIIPVMVVVQVLLRYVFHAPLMGIEEIMLFPTIWLYMLGGAMASQKRNHISCGILTLYIKKDLSMQIFNVVKCFVSFAVSVWLTYWAYWYFLYSLKTWKHSDLVGIPMFLGESAIFLGLLLMTLYAASDLFRDSKILIKGRKLSGEGDK